MARAARTDKTPAHGGQAPVAGAPAGQAQRMALPSALERSPRMTVQRDAVLSIAASPAMVTQRRQIGALVGAPPSRGVVQRAPGRAAVESELLELDEPYGVQQLLEPGQVLDVVEPYETSGPFIKVRLDNTTGWVALSSIEPMAVENDLQWWIGEWDQQLPKGPLAPISVDEFAAADKVRHEIVEFEQAMDELWGGAYLGRIRARLHRYRDVSSEALSGRFLDTIDAIFIRLKIAPDDVAARGLITLLRREMKAQTYTPYFEREVWALLCAVDDGGDFGRLYEEFLSKNTAKGNPSERLGKEQLRHGEAVIGPGSAYTSGKTTTPAPQSDSPPTGVEIERATSLAGLKSIQGEVKTYVLHRRDDANASIYIDGRPTSDDVAQTGLGDCYYLAVVSAIAGRDPDRIRQVIPDVKGYGEVQVRLHFLSGRSFLEQRISVDQHIAFGESGNVKGARFRIKPTGQSLWIARRSDRDASVHAEEIRLYQTALWAPLLEKAYARFAESRGLYGFALKTSNARGYQEITGGGTSFNVYRVFYGAQVAAESYELASEQKVSTLQANVPDDYVKGVQALVRFAASGVDRGGGEPLMLMTASASPRTIFQRIVTYAATMQDRDFGQIHEGRDLVTAQLGILEDKLRELIDQSEGLADDDPSLVPLLSTAENYCRYLLDFLDRGLKGQVPHARLRHLMQLVYDVVGGEASAQGAKRRFAYTRHAYTVSAVSFVGKDGKPLSMEGDDEAVRRGLRKLDWMKSSVTLINPHHGNSPDFSGKRENDTGQFTLWLTQFFRNFTTLHTGVVQR